MMRYVHARLSNLKKYLGHLLFRVRRSTPATINEKITYKKHLDRRPILKTFADKYDVRDYVGSAIGESVLPKNYGVYSRFEDIDFGLLPDNFVLKATHASGATIIVWDRAPEDNVVFVPDANKTCWLKANVVRPNNFDMEKARRLCNRWLGQSLGKRYGEWAYADL